MASTHTAAAMGSTSNRLIFSCEVWLISSSSATSAPRQAHRYWALPRLHMPNRVSTTTMVAGMKPTLLLVKA